MPFSFHIEGTRETIAKGIADAVAAKTLPEQPGALLTALCSDLKLESYGTMTVRANGDRSMVVEFAVNAPPAPVPAAPEIKETIEQPAAGA